MKKSKINPKPSYDEDVFTFMVDLINITNFIAHYSGNFEMCKNLKRIRSGVNDVNVYELEVLSVDDDITTRIENLLTNTVHVA